MQPAPARATSRPRSARSLILLTAAGALAACSDAPTAPSSPAGSGLSPALGKNVGANNRRILFESDRDEAGNMEIYSMNPDGTGVSRLTNSARFDASPAWSPDGKRIAFVSARHDTAGSEIYVMNEDGTGVTRLTNSIGFDVSPSWAKDGKRIVFASTRAAADPAENLATNLDIFTMNDDGTGVTPLTNGGGQDDSPAWSPDGKQIAFVSGRDAAAPGPSELYVMDTDGSRLTRLTYEGGTVRDPSWAPGGKEIAVDIVREESDGTSTVQVYVLHADGTQLTQVTSIGQNGFPSWSPDGKQLAFVSSRDHEKGEIYTMNADGSVQTRLTYNEAVDFFPAWNR